MSRLEQARSYRSEWSKEARTDEEYWTASSQLWHGQLAAHIKKFPDGYELQIPGIVKWAVDVGLNQILVGDTPVVTIALPDGYTDDGRKARLEQAAMGILYALDTYYGQPFRNMVAYGNALGLGILSFPIDRSQWPPHPYKTRVTPGMSREQRAIALEPHTPAERERVRSWEWQRRRRLPWNVQALHPQILFYDFWNTQPQWYILEQQVSRAAMVAQYPHLFKEQGVQEMFMGSVMPTSTLVTYISDDWWAVYLDGQPALTKAQGADPEGVARNRYGMTWIETAESGYGTADITNNPVFRIKGIIRDNRATFVKFISDFNLTEIAKLEYALPTLGMEGQGEDGRDLALAAIDDFMLGRWWPHSNKTRQHKLDLPTIPEAIWRDVEYTKGLMELGIGPEILRGIYQNETLGGQENRIDIANAIYKPLKVQIEHAIAAMLAKMFWQVKYELDDDLTVWARSEDKEMPVLLQREDIVDGLTFHVDTSPSTQRERAMRKDGDIQDLSIKAISLKKYRARQGIYNSDEMEEQNYEDMLMQHPAIVDAIAGIVAEALTGEVQSAVGATRAKQIEEGIPPAGGAPEAVPPAQQGAASPQESSQQGSPAMQPVPQPVPMQNGAGQQFPAIANV